MIKVKIDFSRAHCISNELCARFFMFDVVENCLPAAVLGTPAESGEPVTILRA